MKKKIISVIFMLASSLFVNDVLHENSNIVSINKSEENIQLDTLTQKIDELNSNLEVLTAEVDSISSNEKLYEMLMEIKNEQLSNSQVNLSTFISFSQLYLAIIGLVIALFFGYVQYKLNQVKKVNNEMKDIKIDIDSLSKLLDESNKKAETIRSVYENISPSDFIINNDVANKSDEETDVTNKSEEETDVTNKSEEETDVTSKSEEETDVKFLDDTYNKLIKLSKNKEDYTNKYIPHKYDFQRTIFKGDIYLIYNKESKRERPVLVVQNDIANMYSQEILVAHISSITNRSLLPTQVEINLKGRTSKVMLEKLTTVNRGELTNYYDSLDKYTLNKVNKALKVATDIIE